MPGKSRNKECRIYLGLAGDARGDLDHALARQHAVAWLNPQLGRADGVPRRGRKWDENYIL